MIKRKALSISLKIAIGFLIILSSFVSGWSTTSEGDLPSKTAVILHAINNQLVVPDEQLTPPSFLTGSNSAGGVAFEQESLQIPVSDGSVLPGRMHKPVDAQDAPVIVYYHGGAFMEGYGNIDTHDNIARAIAYRSNAIVISVGYRLAPEHIFPKAVDDSYDALIWAYEQAEEFGGSQEKMIVAGDSAGGNLATVTAMKARNEGGPELQAQLLYYPLTTFHDRPLDTRDKYAEGGYLLSRTVMEKARDSYTPGEEMWENPYVSPLDEGVAEDLPPAFIATAEFDPLRDEGELYAHKLNEEEVPVEAIRYEGVMHGFLSFYEVLATGRHALDDSVEFLDRTLNDEQMMATGFRIIERAQPSGMERIREETEAHMAAVYLLGLHVQRQFQQWVETSMLAESEDE
ncbi:alpha/beta hydrolase [Natribacillus halophilus]|uniref:Acetyl esterase n=1 Tax=Natribacillus halophilus TaxID=549003 RepID=A0A1G8J989_9BACI|nr:alpha/beta hydrolase [Natribacillus halophilus]SDI27210.1 acetyl esterase [Natribacillus halophilus]